MGHLPERISSTTEGLGLVGDADGLEFGQFFGHLPSGMTWNSLSKPKSMSLLDSGVTEMLHEVQLSYRDVPIHGARVKAIHDHAANQTTYLTGSVPDWITSEGAVQPRITEFALSIHQARSAAAEKLGFAEGRFHSPVKIYAPQGKQSLSAAYLFTVSAGPTETGRGPRVPLEIAIDADVGTLLWQRPLAFHVTTGEALLHVENIVASANNKSVVQLPSLLNDGSKLSHALFDVFNCHQRALSDEAISGVGSLCNQKNHNITDGKYNVVPYESEVYDELVSYAAITKAMNWFNSMDQNSLRSSWDDTKWPGSRSNFGLQPSGSNGGSERRLKVYVRTRTPIPSTNRCGADTTPDNAQYLWSGNSGLSGPEILIGYGGVGVENSDCGYRLRELGKDMDVVMHEFGHHVVYRGLSNQKSQSVSMHEGMADYFTYAISGNNLLAENSYPGFRALRQGNIAAGVSFKNFKPKQGGGYASVMDYLTAPHLVGEFWSGILWEIRTKMGKDSTNAAYKFDKIVWDSIDLLRSDAGLYEGMVAYSESAKRYAQRFGDDAAGLQKIIQDAFVKYGFADYSSSGEFQVVAELVNSVSTATEPVTKVSKTRRWGCGDVAGLSSENTRSAQASGSILVLLALLALPTAAALVTTRARRTAQRAMIRVRIQRRRD